MIIIVLMLLSAQGKVYKIDEDTDVNVYYKGSVSLKIDSNPSTGYSWEMILKEGSYFETDDVKGKYYPPAEQKPGAGGYQLFNLACSENCIVGYKQEVKFEYARPWESDPVTVRKVMVSAVAEKNS